MRSSQPSDLFDTLGCDCVKSSARLYNLHRVRCTLNLSLMCMLRIKCNWSLFFEMIPTNNYRGVQYRVFRKPQPFSPWGEKRVGEVTFAKIHQRGGRGTFVLSCRVGNSKLSTTCMGAKCLTSSLRHSCKLSCVCWAKQTFNQGTRPLRFCAGSQSWCSPKFCSFKQHTGSSFLFEEKIAKGSTDPINLIAAVWQSKWEWNPWLSPKSLHKAVCKRDGHYLSRLGDWGKSSQHLCQWAHRTFPIHSMHSRVAPEKLCFPVDFLISLNTIFPTVTKSSKHASDQHKKFHHRLYHLDRKVNPWRNSRPIKFDATPDMLRNFVCLCWLGCCGVNWTMQRQHGKCFLFDSGWKTVSGSSAMEMARSGPRFRFPEGKLIGMCKNVDTFLNITLGILNEV